MSERDGRGEKRKAATAAQNEAKSKNKASFPERLSESVGAVGRADLTDAASATALEELEGAGAGRANDDRQSSF